MTCPRCGVKDQCQIVYGSENSTGYNVCGGVCGYVCLGPLGLLCGLKNEKVTKHFWVCNNCGAKFSM